MCDKIPEVVVFPFVPVTAIFSFFMYFEVCLRKSGYNFNIIIPINDVPEVWFLIVIANFINLAITSNR